MENDIVITTDGATKKVAPKNGTDYQLEELQEIVGGYIEMLYSPNEQCMVVNEEGWLNGLPVNDKATELCQEWGYGSNVVVGNVLVTSVNSIK